jgi:hypothetical protein
LYVRFTPPAASTYSGNITITGGGLACTVNVGVNGTGAAACTGTPTGGTAVATPTTASSSTAIALSLTGSTVAGGITYQWQSSPDNSSWTDISGATLATATYTGITANTYFKAVLTCPTFASASSGSQLVTFALPASGCTPTFTYSCPGYPMHTAMNSLTGYTGSLVDPVTTTCGANFEDKTTLSTATLLKGSSYTATIGLNSSYSSSFAVQVWIDFNDDGSFSSTETVGGLAYPGIPSSVSSTTITLAIPSTAAAGMHRMRLMGNYNSTGFTNYPLMNPCPTASVNYGNVRDYRINIIPPPPSVTTAQSSVAFGNVTTGTSSVPVMFLAATGANLLPAVSGTVTATSSSSNFLVSTDGAGWASSVNIPYTSGGFAKNVYVQFNPTASIAYSGSISFTGGGLASAVTVPVTGSGIATACSGTPTAGTASISPSTGGSTTTFVLSLPGATVDGGLFYQWQSSPDNSTWTNLQDGISSTYTFKGLSANTYYRAIVTCGTGTPVTSGSVLATASGLTTASCTSGWSDPSNSCYSYGMWVRIAVTGASGSINDASTSCNGTGYLNQTSLSATFNAGSSYNATIYTGTSNSVSNQIWIDFNNDGTFQSSETVGGTSTGFLNSTVVAITIPSTVNAGAYRMRVANGWISNAAIYPNMNACTPYSYGESRDYKVVIAGGACSGTPKAGVVSGTPTSACTAYNAAIFNVGETVGGGMSYQWQSSTTSATAGFSNIGGATNTAYVPGVSSSTYYRMVATCGASSATSAAQQYQVNPPPAAITGTGTICLGKTSTLSDATAGGTWSSSNTAIATVGSSSGVVTGVASGTATITYISAPGAGCQSTTVVTINALPTIASVSPSSTSLCPGVTLTLTAGSVTGTGTLTSYNWSGPNSYNTTGTATTAARLLTATADGGVYSLTVTYPGAGCTSNAAVTSTITVSPLPTLTNTTNNGPICVGTTLALTANTPTNVTGYSWSGPVAITGATTASATIPAATTAATGVYSVVVNNGAGTGCTATYTTSATVSPMPSLATVSTSGTICANNTLNLTSTGPANVTGYAWTGPVAITGSTSASAAVPSAQTSGTGVYTVTVNNGTGLGCTMTYTASATIQASSPVYTVTGGGAYCTGGTGVPVGLSNSVAGIQYQLYLGSSTVGGIVTGTGAPLNFGMQTALGTYSVSATNTSTGCVANMSATPVVSTSSVPNVYSVAGGGGYCSGGVGAIVTLTSSDAGVTYQLYRGATAAGGLVSGTGSSISFAPQTVAGTYTVVANPGSTCATNMSGSTVIFINGIPTTYNVTGGGGYCTGSGGTHVGIDWSNPGTNYQLYLGATPIGSTFAGTGAGLDFGLVATAGTYSVLGTIVSTGCQNAMTGTTTVSINALPTAFSVTGGGNYCSGGTGVSVGLASSVAGINYQLYNGSSTIGSAVAGTGSALDFGAQTAAGGYTVMATNATTSCTAGMTGSASISINALPVQYTVTGGGIYCAGTSGVHTFLSGSTSGINYQLYNGATTIGAAVPGNGGSLDFGFVTAAGTYSVLASNAATSCQRAMSGTASVSINAAPTAYTVNGGGAYCSGGTGIAVGLSNSTAGTSYQLYNGATTVGAAASGTGAALSFGNQTAAGTYTVLATNGSTGCTGAMTGTATVTINSLPNTYSMTGGGNYCSGGTGLAVGLNGSNSGISYQLYRASTPVGTAVTGTGSALAFGLQTAAGDYTVIATNGTTTCSSTMTGTATIVVNPLPTAFTVTGGGNYCSGGSGVVVGLSSSAAGTSYQLYNGASIMGGAISGTGTTLSFGFQTSSGTYTVLATNASSCTAAMTGSATVSINSLPTAYSVTGGGNYCAGGTGVAIGLGGSNSGINYQLYNGVTTVGSPVGGTGGSISFGSQTAAGNYSVVATNTSTSCTSNMTGGATVGILSIPTAYTVTGGGQYCSGSTGVTVGLSSSNTGVNYQLYNGGSAVGSAVPGTAAALTFGTMTTAGTYTVLATSTSNSCTNVMSGNAPVIVNALPTVYTVSGGGQYCAGSTGLHVYLSSSNLGVNYQLYNGSAPVGSPVAGSAAALDFGTLTNAGTYTVSASSATTGCTRNMSGTAAITVNPTPTVYSVTGGGQYCNGGTGVYVGLSGSNTGINYQLMNGAAAVGSPMTGTGTALDFGLITTGGNYNVVAQDATTSCASNMSGGATVTVNSLPSVFTVTGGGAYCNGGSGVTVGLSGSTPGVAYQLYNGVAASGSLLAGTGLPLDFGLKTAGGNYTVMAINTTTACNNTMFGSANVTVNANPTVYAVNGGGQYCSGGTGVTIGLSNSAVGVDYQLYSGAAVVGAPVTGTGGALSFGLLTTPGTYTVAATNGSTSCASNMSGNATVIIRALPTVYIMTGGGQYCSGGTGVAVGLNGSNLGITYQLFNGAIPTGGAVAGTGAAISFGAQTAAGTYNVVASNVSTSCVNNMSGTANVTVNPAPVAYAVTGGGNYCSGGAGTNVGLANSNLGINYQLYNGTTAVGGPVAGTGAALDFGAQTTAGSYNVIATNASTMCTSNMTGAVSINVNALPVAHTVTGGGNFCTGASGVTVGLSGSNTGVIYQLYNGSTAVGTAVAGTGSAISFGVLSGAGSYTVLATNTSTACNNTMMGVATVGINVVPTAHTITGGGSMCIGDAGIAVGLGSSNTGISYQLYNGSVATGSPVAGTGGTISFGAQTSAGTYTVMATNIGTGCANGMTGLATVVVNPLPSAYNITGGGTYCVGASGVVVGLSGSNTGVAYQLYNGTSAVGLPLSSSGTPLSFGTQTLPGSYNVIAQDLSTGCVSNMTGAANVIVNPAPIVYTMTGGGSYCAGGSGVPVGLSSSNSGINYQLFRGGTPLATVPGTGGAISFGTQTNTGTYSIVATNATTSCPSNMSGAATVSINALPNAYSVVSPASTYCQGGSGINIMLANSETGVSYQLYDGSLTMGAPVTGTGSMLDFGPQTSAGVYVVVATSGASCTSNMTGSASIAINPLPIPYPIGGGGGYCAGGVGSVVTLAGSTTGMTYQLYRGTTMVGAAIPGTGAPISFAPQTTVGTYVIRAANSTTGCNRVMTGSVAVSVNAVPVAQTVTGGGNYCAGGSGLSVNVSSSAAGVDYKLYKGTTLMATIPGTGSSLSFGPQTAAGVYTVVASNSSTSCSNNMIGSAIVVVNALPTPYTVSGGGNYCVGTVPGAVVGLGNSTMGITYQLFNGISPVGGIIAGTGSALDFGMQSASGVYTIKATDATSLCSSVMSGSATVNANLAPAAHTMTGGGSYCIGGAGVHVGLDGSNTGTSYRLYNGSTAIGSAMSGTGSSLDFGSIAGAGIYTVLATNTSTACTGNMNGSAPVSITSSVTPTVAINTGVGDTLCHGILTTFTASAVNGGSVPTYQWQVNGVNVGLGGSTYNYLPLDGDVVSVQMTSSSSCATPSTAMASKPVTVLVSQLPVATIATANETVCAGAPVTFNATSLFGGSAPTLTWMKNGVSVATGTTSYTYMPANGDEVYVKMTSNYRCRLANLVESDHITMVVDVPQTPIVALSTSSEITIVSGQSVTITAAATQAGHNPEFQWYINSAPIPGATTNVFTSVNLHNNDSVTCLVTNVSACAPTTGFKTTVVKISTEVGSVSLSSSDIKLLPNPNKGEFIVRGTLGTTDDQELTAEVTNMLGQVVYKEKITVRNGNINERILLSNTLANGMYMLSLHSSNENKVFHFVLEQ